MDQYYRDNFEEILDIFCRASEGGVFSVRLDDELMLLFANENYYKIFGCTKDGLFQQTQNKFARSIYPDDAELMDIRMPVMDGLQATHGIRNLHKKSAKAVPIIAMTANAFDDDVEKSRNVGMNAHLTKPIEPAHLHRTLYHYISGEEDTAK